MADTLTYKLKSHLEEKIREKLESIDFSFHEHQDAFWRASGNECVVVFYKSGKIVIQGKDSEYIANLLGCKDEDELQMKIDLE